MRLRLWFQPILKKVQPIMKTYEQGNQSQLNAPPV